MKSSGRLQRVAAVFGITALTTVSGLADVGTAATSAAAHHLRNISSRGQVGSGPDVLIGGLIITGGAPKDVLIRAIGPSLQVNGVPLAGRLADPVLELYAEGSDLPIATNDNWKDTQQSVIAATGLPPGNDLESAISRTLVPGHYTTVVRGRNGGTGTALVEAYELTNTSDPKLANISTRGLVQAASVLIGGFIVGGGDRPDSSVQVIVRALAPSLAEHGLPNPLPDPTLDLFDANGNSLGSNDDWHQGAFIDIGASGLAPPDDREAVIISVLPAGNYTAVVRGKGQASGTALVEVYDVPTKASSGP